MSEFLINGLVLAGGESSRLKEINIDKAKLRLSNGDYLIEKLCKILNIFCNKVYISGNKKSNIQNFEPIKDKYQFIDDAFDNLNSPINGILSAFNKDKSASWLVVACDLPLLNEKVIKELIMHRDSSKFATAYLSKHENLPEPMCAIYEDKIQPFLIDFVKNNVTCPRKILLNLPIKEITLENDSSLFNLNTPQDFEYLKNLNF